MNWTVRRLRTPDQLQPGWCENNAFWSVIGWTECGRRALLHVVAQLRILVVDDDEALRRAIVRVVRREFFVVDVESMTAAVRELERAPYDVVITDHKMPSGSGADLLAVVRRRWPFVRRILTSGDEVEPGALADAE